MRAFEADKKVAGIRPGEKRGNAAMHRITLDAEAGQVSAELARRVVTAETRVHVLVEVPGDVDVLPMPAIAQAGGAFDWLAEEPDIYTDADLVQPRIG